MAFYSANLHCFPIEDYGFRFENKKNGHVVTDHDHQFINVQHYVNLTLKSVKQ